MWYCFRYSHPTTHYTPGKIVRIISFYDIILQPYFYNIIFIPFKKLVFHRLGPQLYKYEFGIIPIALRLFKKIALFIIITHEIVIS